jgi:hypothetical protein
MLDWITLEKLMTLDNEKAKQLINELITKIRINYYCSVQDLQNICFKISDGQICPDHCSIARIASLFMAIENESGKIWYHGTITDILKVYKELLKKEFYDMSDLHKV